MRSRLEHPLLIAALGVAGLFIASQPQHERQGKGAGGARGTVAEPAPPPGLWPLIKRVSTEALDNDLMTQAAAMTFYTLLVLIFGLSACMTGPVLLTPSVRSEMPLQGSLHPGEVVLVDDGGCPAGQLKRLTGGSNRTFGTNLEQAGSRDQIECVPRP